MDPLGVTFAGRAWSEHMLLRQAYAAYEQASDMRKAPPGLRALEPNLLSSGACRQARALRREAQRSSDVCLRGETGRTAASPVCRLVTLVVRKATSRLRFIRLLMGDTDGTLR